MNERCVDASVGVKCSVKGEAHREEARSLLKDSGAANIRLIAPPLFVVEIDSVIRRRVFDGRMSDEQARKAYSILDLAPVNIMDVPGLRQQAREIAKRFNQRFVYDATYAALAELRNCEFRTADKMFYDAVKNGLAFVRYLPDYR